jgi:hypothetical protein
VLILPRIQKSNHVIYLKKDLGLSTGAFDGKWYGMVWNGIGAFMV